MEKEQVDAISVLSANKFDSLHTAHYLSSNTSDLVTRWCSGIVCSSCSPVSTDASITRKRVNSVSADALVDFEQVVEFVVANSAVCAARVALVDGVSSARVDHLVVLSALELGSLSRNNGHRALSLAPLELVFVLASVNVRDALLVSNDGVLESALNIENLHRLGLNICDLNRESFEFSGDINNIGLKLSQPDLTPSVLSFEGIELGGKVCVGLRHDAHVDSDRCLVAVNGIKAANQNSSLVS